ncbi:MAG: hypothetical protein CL612_01415 [Anaerolineaceae bacterium]|nr:hypothetical protein [Anaerolineaceae bacterium]
MLDSITKKPLQPHAIGVSIVLLTTIIFFWPVLVGGDWHIPYGGGDLESFLWPTYRFAAQSLHTGALPLWNPYLHSGSPYAADNQSGLFYLPNLILAILPNISYRIMEWLVVLHVFIAGVGMYFAANHHYKSKDISPPLVAALAFQFSSIFVTHIGNLNIIASASYLPWAWLCTLRLRDTPTLTAASILAIPLSLSIFSGHAQISLIVCTPIFIYSVWQLKVTLTKQKWFGLISYTAALTIGVSAVFVFPSIEMSQYTHRASFTYEEASRFSIPIEGLAGMISPLLFGRGAEHFWPGWDRVELGFAGLTTLILATLGMRMKTLRTPLLLIATIGIVIAIGNATPIHRLMYDYIPGFSLLRVPARFILLTNFSISMLASAGLHYWQTNTISNKNISKYLLSATIVAIIVLTIAWTVASHKYPNTSSNTLAIAVIVCLITLLSNKLVSPRWIVLLLAVELIALGTWIEIDYRNPNKGYIEGPAVKFLRTQPGPYRIDVAASSWQPNAPLVHEIESINGLHNPMTISHYDNYYWSVNHRGSPQYNFLNVKFLVTDKDKPAADASFIPVYDEDSLVDIYLNTNSLSRINLIYNSINVDTELEAFDAIHSLNFDPLQNVVIQDGLKLNSGSSDKSSLSYLQYTAHSHTIHAITKSDAYLVFSEVWYPGWSVTIDGIPSEFSKANYAFRAVYIPAGEHIIHVEFKPQIWYVSLGISIFALLIIILTTSSPYLFKRRNIR